MGLLRAHVGDGANGGVDLRKLRSLRQQREPEIENLDSTARRDQDIARLNVSVDDTGVMSGLQTRRDLLGDVERFLDG